MQFKARILILLSSTCLIQISKPIINVFKDNTRIQFMTPYNNFPTPGDTKMVVLNTDMEHQKWSILYSCNVHSRTKYRWETIGIWSRSEFLDDMMRETLKDYMIGLGFPMESHKFHSQEGC